MIIHFLLRSTPRLDFRAEARAENSAMSEPTCGVGRIAVVGNFPPDLLGHTLSSEKRS